MSTQKTFPTGIILSAMLLMSTMVMAQHQKPVPSPVNPYQGVVPANSNAGTYSFKLYNTPNNMYGYNIYKDGNPVYHQFALMFISKEGKRLIATKPQAEKAAAIAIGKIKRGEPPLLSADEIEKIVAL